MATSEDVDTAVASVGEIGVHRSFYQWDQLDFELRVIRQGLEARRMPWTSFKPPQDSSRPWADVAAGRYDDALAARASAYASLDGPLLVTFHHEPEGDHHAGLPGEWAAAWTRVHDVMRHDHDLEHVALVPILGGWVFDSRSEFEPAVYLTDDVLSRADLIGLDVYQSESGEPLGDKIEGILDWLDDRGVDHQIGIGEVGCTDQFGPPGAAVWWHDAWSWMTENVDRVGVVSYFNSMANSRADWRLDESPTKREAFRESLASEQVCTLRHYDE
jgi:hypothetical protein